MGKATQRLMLLLSVMLFALVGAPAVSALPLEQPAGTAVVESPYAGKKVGIVGHSFTSANGADNGTVTYRDTESYQPGTTGPDNLCFRSRHAAAVQVAEQLGMAYVFAACAGAEPEHIYKTPQYDEGLQADWLTPDMDVVIMGGRGNPEFGQAISQLVDPSQDPFLHCSLQGAVPGQCDAEATLLQWAVTAYENRGQEEQTIYDTIQARAPNAQVYAMGIPPVVPKLGDNVDVCKWFLSDYEITPLANLIDSLNAMIRETAERNGAIFVDMSRPESPWVQARHDLCAPYPDAWVWGPRLLVPPYEGALTNPEMWATGSFHPTIPANNAMAAVLLLTMLESAPPA